MFDVDECVIMLMCIGPQNTIWQCLDLFDEKLMFGNTNFSILYLTVPEMFSYLAQLKNIWWPLFVCFNLNFCIKKKLAYNTMFK